MRVLMLGWEFPPFRSGGLGTHCYHLTKSLSSLGTQTTFLMPKTSLLVKCDFMKIIEVEPGFFLGPYIPKFFFSEKYNGNLFDDVWRYNKSCKEYALKEQFDVIHCHDWMTSIAGLEIKKESGRPLVATIHSTEYDRTGSLAPNQWILDRERDVVRGADLVITVSEFMKKQLVEKFNVDPEKIVVIYNAIDHENWMAKEVKCRFPNEKVVLFMGRLTLQKGPDFFLDAAKKVLEKNKNVRFVIGGKGDMLPQLIQQSINLGIFDKILFLGFVPDDQLPGLYAAADVFVLPSVSEPFGITVLEAIASGTPAIISKQSGVREVVKNAFVVDFWDINEMANKILGLITYPPLKEVMSREGKEEICKYTWKKIAEQTLADAYERACSRQMLLAH